MLIALQTAYFGKLCFNQVGRNRRTCIASMAFMPLLHVRGCLFIASSTLVSMICTNIDNLAIAVCNLSTADAKIAAFLLVTIIYVVPKLKDMLSMQARNAPPLFLHNSI